MGHSVTPKIVELIRKATKSKVIGMYLSNTCGSHYMDKESSKQFASTGLAVVTNYGYDGYFIMDPNKTAKTHKKFASTFINHIAKNFKS